MEKLNKPILNSVLDVISAANQVEDKKVIRKKVLETLYSAISADGILFFIPDENYCLADQMSKGIDPFYHSLYKVYYKRFDRYNVGDMKLIIPKHRINYDGFQRTEFYNDFLKPQNIHYKLVFNLTTENEIVGKIMLTRSKKIDHFTPNDIKVAEYISPYLAHGLYHNTLRSQVKMQSNIINYLENQFSTGIILLDKNLKTIYMNQKARKLLRYFNASGKVDQKTMQLDSKLLEDCRKLQAKLIKFPTNSTVIPEKRVIKGRDKKRFNLTSKTFDPQQGWDSSCAFMICIEELSESNDIKWKRFMKYFHLSPREIDVLPYLFSGLKNAEIAEKLFVSEITIKKHLQSIYAKVGVKNRTSLINKIVTQFPASPLTVQKWS